MDDSQLVKQDENKLDIPNPTGAGGFGDNPQNINKNGRPPKGMAWSEVLENVSFETDQTTGLNFRQRVARKLWETAMTGDIQAIRLLFDRMDGAPIQRQIIREESDRSIERLADTIDRMLRQPDTDTEELDSFS
ncbi:MAG TPA: hypothetical protein VLE44_00745 [Candidatus Saccharimonadales bacterium]|nr:hypothetical protein [Candidatus Saccharimonadales bacterium]